jgi:hypothetical protein
MLGIFGLLLAYLLKHSGKFLSESVTSKVSFLGPDPITGCPQWDDANPQTIPNPGGTWVAPLSSSASEGTTNTPTNPNFCTCPSGYGLWKDGTTKDYWCVQGSGAATPTGAGTVKETL